MIFKLGHSISDGRKLFSRQEGRENGRSTAVPNERHYRSLIKAVSWRMVGTLDTMIISFIVTRRLKFAFSIGFIELFTKITLFYLHERGWNKIPFGRRLVKTDYQI